jgi:RNA recognition motif-containing protein
MFFIRSYLYHFFIRYVGNLPSGVSIPQIADFFNSAMKHLGLAADQNSVVSAWLSPDSTYAFLELRTISEAFVAITYLNGLQIGTQVLKVGRPKGYIPSPNPDPTINIDPTKLKSLDLIALSFLNSIFPVGSVQSLTLNTISAEPLSNVIIASNFPALVSEKQIIELFTAFGEVCFYILSCIP